MDTLNDLFLILKSFPYVLWAVYALIGFFGLYLLAWLLGISLLPGRKNKAAKRPGLLRRLYRRIRGRRLEPVEATAPAEPTMPLRDLNPLFDMVEQLVGIKPASLPSAVSQLEQLAISGEIMIKAVRGIGEKMGLTGATVTTDAHPKFFDVQVMRNHIPRILSHAADRIGAMPAENNRYRKAYEDTFHDNQKLVAKVEELQGEIENLKGSLRAAQVAAKAEEEVEVEEANTSDEAEAPSKNHGARKPGHNKNAKSKKPELADA
jgi:hypothetical protein